MKTVLNKNCSKKVKAGKRQKLLAEIGTNAYIEKIPQRRLGMSKAASRM